MILFMKIIKGKQMIYQINDLPEEYKDYPSPSRVHNATMSESKRLGLQLWRERVGEDVADKIMVESQDRGTNIHEKIENYSKSGIITNELFNTEIFSYLSKIEEFYAVESWVYHLLQRYKGKFDSFFKINNEMVMCDWKTKKDDVYKKKDWVSDNFEQVSCYVKAINNLHNLDVKKAVIIFMNSEGNQLQFFEMNENLINYHYRNFILRLNTYRDIVAKEILDQSVIDLKTI